MLKIACIIPARLKSTRFPRKILTNLKGKPLIQWTWEAAKATNLFDEVAIALDSTETAAVVERFGGKYFMTSENCISGTHRLSELAERGAIDADIWVNWQVDEPFIHRRMIEDLLQSCQLEQSDVWTLKKRLKDPKEIESPSVSKVVCDARGNALYFSRYPIPYYREHTPEHEKIIFKHIGIYAFSAEAIRKLSHMPSPDIELAEHLEQLRFLYHGLKIKVHETRYQAIGIDLPEHLALAESFIEDHRELT